MEGPQQQTRFSLSFSERVHAFRKDKTWDNFKAIFLGRTVSIVTNAQKNIPPPGASPEDLDISKNRPPSRDISKAKEVTQYIQQNIPEDEPTPQYDARFPQTSLRNALELVEQGNFGQLASMFRSITREEDFIALRAHLMEHGALYNCTDDQGKACEGAEEIVREVSMKFDGPFTRRFKEIPYRENQSLTIPLDEQLEREFSDPEDFQNLCDTLYNDGYFTQPAIVAAIQKHSRTFDSPKVLRAKDLFANYKNDPAAFQEYVQQNFTTGVAVQELRDNLYDHAFLVEEMLHGFRLDSSKKVLPFLNQLTSQLISREEETKLQHDKYDMLHSENDAAIQEWLKTAAASREDAAWLLPKAQYGKKTTAVVLLQLQAHYKQLVDKEIITPMLDAGRKFAGSKACAAAREEYEGLKLPEDKDRQRELQIQLAAGSPELKQMMAQFSREISLPDGTVSTRASLEELSRLEEAIDQSELEPMAKDVTRRAMFLSQEVVSSALFEKMMLQLNSGDLKGLEDEFMQLAHPDDYNALQQELEDTLRSRMERRRISRAEYIEITRDLDSVVKKTRAKLFPQGSR